MINQNLNKKHGFNKKHLIMGDMTRRQENNCEENFFLSTSVGLSIKKSCESRLPFELGLRTSLDSHSANTEDYYNFNPCKSEVPNLSSSAMRTGGIVCSVG